MRYLINWMPLAKKSSDFKAIKNALQTPPPNQDFYQKKIVATDNNKGHTE